MPREGEDGQSKLGKASRQRNVIATKSSHNKWALYKRRITKHLTVLRTQTHFADVMTKKKRDRMYSSAAAVPEISEVTICLRKIATAKIDIMNTFREIAAEYQGHRVFLELSAEGNESGLIDIEQVIRYRTKKLHELMLS